MFDVVLDLVSSQDKNSVLKDLASEVSKMINDELNKMEKTVPESKDDPQSSPPGTLRRMMLLPTDLDSPVKTNTAA